MKVYTENSITFTDFSSVSGFDGGSRLDGFGPGVVGVRANSERGLRARLGNVTRTSKESCQRVKTAFYLYIHIYIYTYNMLVIMFTNAIFYLAFVRKPCANLEASVRRGICCV